MSALSQLQLWFHTVITNPYGVQSGEESAIQSNQENAPIAETIIPSSRQTSAERIEVYAAAYYGRLLECMEEEFPACVAAIEAEAFRDLAYAYLVENPSKSYTLHHLSQNFPAFLRSTRPPRETTPDYFDFLADLATLERTYSEVFDGPGVENNPSPNRDSWIGIPPERMKLVPVPCLRLLQFDYPVQEFASAVRDGKNPDLPEPKKTYLAITRRDFVVRRFELEERSFLLVEKLASGTPLLRALAETFPNPGEVEGQVFEWFREWFQAPLFYHAEEDSDEQVE